MQAAQYRISKTLPKKGPKPNTTIASNVFDTKAPLPSDSTLEVLVNGEKAFGKVYEAINNAQNSVEIVCWGFQPSMYFIRGKQEKNIGELLLQKAEEGETGNMTLHRIFCVIWVWK